MKYRSSCGKLSWLALPVLLISASPLLAQTPEWIWFDNKGAAPPPVEIRYFRKAFDLPGPIRSALLTAAGDDQVVVFINGKRALGNRHWNEASSANVTRELRAGLNIIAARGQNREGDAGVIVKLEVTLATGQKKTIVTDETWLAGAERQEDWLDPRARLDSWVKPLVRGKLGVQPWGDVMAPRQATPVSQMTVLPGFKVELMRSAQPGEGSWICMAIDPKGRLIISPQGDEPMLRVTLDDRGGIEKIEPIPLPVGSAMGLLYAFDSLYVSGRGPDGLALYRLTDTQHHDQFDHIEMLRKFGNAGGEHGSHALVLGPDNHIYYIHGNFVKQAPDNSPASPHKHYAEDQLLPRQEDGNGFGVGLKPPGGFLVRMDRDAKTVELYAAGMRNTYDFAFNSDGEIVAFDSDMEWDWGLPWYRPIRVLHLVSGGDYGFREGSGKWPAYYPDSLPPVVNVGIGSPTGVIFGTGAKFPARYQRACFMMDWSYGRLLAVHLTPKGASYSATFENLLRGIPLNLTAMVIGHDGALYFVTGGRGTQSGLYCVSYVGSQSVAPADCHDLAGKADRELRHELEKFHGLPNPRALDFAWPQLDNPDRFIRYAARIAIEAQDPETWAQRALEETRPEAAITALLALARVGQARWAPDLIRALGRLDPAELSRDQKLEALRVLELACIRMGHPSAELSEQIVDRLDPAYPTPDEDINHELCQILIYFQAPDAIAKTLALADQAREQENQIYYLFRLRTVRQGWTLDQRKMYFTLLNQRWEGKAHPSELLQWFADVDRQYINGASFPRFMANIKADAMETLTPEELAAVAPILRNRPAEPSPLPKARSRSFVHEWKMEDLLPALDELDHGRSFKNGEQAFVDAQCVACHRFGEAGGAVGPELTAVGSRFAARDVLDSILEPSKVVSEQYQNTAFLLKNGDDITGRVIEDSPDKIVVQINTLTPEKLVQTKTIVHPSDVAARRASKISPMPEGLANVLSRNDILDLIAFLESGGNPHAKSFSP